MIIRILLLPYILLLVACAANLPESIEGTDIDKNQAMNTQASIDGYAVVYIYRFSAFMNAGVDYLIGFDPTPVVTLENSSFTRIEVPPGVYKFNFASSEEDYNKPAYDFSYSGSKELEVRTDTVNLVHFVAYPGSFTSMEYDLGKLKEISELDFFIPTYSIVNTALKLADALPAPAEASENNKTVEIPKISDSMIKRFEGLKLSETCALASKNWVFTGKECLSGLANGFGSSEDATGLKFIGEFQQGKRVKGEIFQGDNMIFAGDLVEDKPHGNAICFHETEYEECRFYKGKRIDMLYKIRKENAKMTQDIERLKKANASSTANNGSLSDNVQNEMLGRAASLIFDSLF